MQKHPIAIISQYTEKCNGDGIEKSETALFYIYNRRRILMYFPVTAG